MSFWGRLFGLKMPKKGSLNSVEVGSSSERACKGIPEGHNGCLFAREVLQDPLDAIEFDPPSKWTYKGIIDGHKVWHDPVGDGIGLFFFDLPPDLPRAPTYSGFISALTPESDPRTLKYIETGTICVAGINCVRRIVRVPQKPSGMTYVGSWIIPFRDFSFVLKAQCQEYGVTGMREAILLDEKFATGEARITEDNTLDLSYDPDDVLFDSRFPGHPISRLRAILTMFEEAVSFRKDLYEYTAFPVLLAPSET